MCGTAVTSDVETRVTPATGEAESSLNARILDVSSGGVRMEVGRFFEPGDLLTLELPPPGQYAVGIACSPAWSIPRPRATIAASSAADSPRS